MRFWSHLLLTLSLATWYRRSIPDSREPPGIELARGLFAVSESATWNDRDQVALRAGVRPSRSHGGGQRDVGEITRGIVRRPGQGCPVVLVNGWRPVGPGCRGRNRDLCLERLELAAQRCNRCRLGGCLLAGLVCSLGDGANRDQRHGEASGQADDQDRHREPGRERPCAGLTRGSLAEFENWPDRFRRVGRRVVIFAIAVRRVLLVKALAGWGLIIGLLIAHRGSPF